MAKDTMATTVPATVWWLGGEPYFPSYTQKDLYCGGYTKDLRTESELIALGAKPEPTNLWPRYYWDKPQ
jgi:hypothetical protein